MRLWFALLLALPSGRADEVKTVGRTAPVVQAGATGPGQRHVPIVAHADPESVAPSYLSCDRNTRHPSVTYAADWLQRRHPRGRRGRKTVN